MNFRILLTASADEQLTALAEILPSKAKKVRRWFVFAPLQALRIWDVSDSGRWVEDGRWSWPWRHSWARLGIPFWWGLWSTLVDLVTPDSV